MKEKIKDLPKLTIVKIRSYNYCSKVAKNGTLAQLTKLQNAAKY